MLIRRPRSLLLLPDLPGAGGGGASMGGPWGAKNGAAADLAVGEWWVFGCINCELAKNSEVMPFCEAFI